MDELKISQEKFKQKNKFNEYMNMSRASYIKKDYESARNHIAEALKIFPSDLDARELAADILWALGKTSLASNEYKAIYDKDNTRIIAEKKYAKTVLALYDKKLKEQSIENLLSDKKKENKQQTGMSSYILALILPGLPQILSGKTVKGIIILTIYMLLSVITLATINVEDIFQDRMFSDLKIWFLFIIIIYGLIDIAVTSRK